MADSLLRRRRQIAHADANAQRSGDVLRADAVLVRASSTRSRPQPGGQFPPRAGEKIFGCGESFTRLDKRGQKIVLYVRDAMGVQSQRMYKPIPFFLSSRGYGMFVHTSAPTTFDFGQDFDQSNVIYTGDDELDLFVFLGTPKQVLDEYTASPAAAPCRRCGRSACG